MRLCDRQSSLMSQAAGLVVEIIRSNDAVLISAVEALLTAAGLGVFVADRHVSAIEGSIGAFQRRIMVPREDERQARRVLIEAGLGGELRDHG